MIAHERAVRSSIPAGGPLRTPHVLAAGRRWLLEEAIEDAGGDRVDAVVAAAAAIAGLELREAPRRAERGGLSGRLRRRARLLRSPISARDVARAKLIGGSLDLPRVASHGDFHAGNVLVRGGLAWVVDWELSGPRPAGYDLLRYWSSARDEERDRLFQAAVDVVGQRYRRELLRLRYVVAVTTAAQQLAAADEFNRDVQAAKRLLRDLPEIREAAGV